MSYFTSSNITIGEYQSLTNYGTNMKQLFHRKPLFFFMDGYGKNSIEFPMAGDGGTVIGRRHRGVATEETAEIGLVGKGESQGYFR